MAKTEIRRAGSDDHRDRDLVVVQLGPGVGGVVAVDDRQQALVDILKSDTQGYDFEVFKGAQQAMRDNRIGLLYFEFIFSDMYKNLPPFDEVFRLTLKKHGADHAATYALTTDRRFF